MIRLTPVALTILTLTLTAGTAQTADVAKIVTAPKPEAKADAALAKVIQGNFVSKGPVIVEGVIERDDVQRVCSQFVDRNVVPATAVKKLGDAQFKTTHYPADNTWLGDWKEGGKTVQNGHGMQFSDPASTVNGANCYVCRHLSKNEPSHGTIGPSLYQYDKLCGSSEAILRYTWGKIYNFNAYAACSNILRFGHKGILTEQQIRDMMAPLFGPASPVNQ